MTIIRMDKNDKVFPKQVHHSQHLGMFLADDYYIIFILFYFEFELFKIKYTNPIE